MKQSLPLSSECKTIVQCTDKEKRHPDRGGNALQVNGGGGFTWQFVRCRKIRVRELD